MKRHKHEMELKTIGELLKEKGYDRGSSASTKAAFIKYLIKETTAQDVQIPELFQSAQATSGKPQQLEFDEALLGKSIKPKVG